MPKTTLDYQELQNELQDIVARLEDGELDIDEAVKCYERGLQVVKLLEERLARADNKISELRGTDGDV